MFWQSKQSLLINRRDYHQCATCPKPCGVDWATILHQNIPKSYQNLVNYVTSVKNSCDVSVCGFIKMPNNFKTVHFWKKRSPFSKSAQSKMVMYELTRFCETFRNASSDSFWCRFFWKHKPWCTLFGNCKQPKKSTCLH